MSKNKIFIGLAVVVAVAAAVVLQQEPKQQQAESSAGVLKIGAILPLTGPVSAVGDQIRKSITLANEGRAIELVFEDSANAPAKGVAAFNKLVNIDKVDAIIVAMSGISKTIAPLAKDNSIATLAISTSVPVVDSADDFVIRYFIDGVAEAASMAKYLAESGVKRIAVAKINDAYGSVMYDSFIKTLAEYKLSPVHVESYERKITDFKSSAAKLIAAKPESIYFIGYARPLAIAIKQTYEAGARIPFASTFGFEIPGTKKFAGIAAEGLIYTSVKFGQGMPLSSESEKFIQQFQKRYSQLPSNDAAFAYDIVLNLPYLKELGALKDPSKLVGKSIESQFGSIAFNNNLEARVPIVIKQVKGDSVVLVK